MPRSEIGLGRLWVIGWRRERIGSMVAVVGGGFVRLSGGGLVGFWVGVVERVRWTFFLVLW